MIRRAFAGIRLSANISGTLYMSKRAAQQAGPAPQPPSPRPKRKRPRTSHIPRLHLTLAQVENMAAALGFADRIGLRPNLAIDIHFDKGGLDDPLSNAGRALRAFKHSIRQCVERRGGRFACIWVMENRAGRGGDVGIHAHLLVHIPPHLLDRFDRHRATWALKAGFRDDDKVILAKPVRTLRGAAGKLKYICKDLDPEHWPIFNINGKPVLDDRGKPSDQPVYGQKCGVSRNIDAKARDAHRLQQLDRQ